MKCLPGIAACFVVLMAACGEESEESSFEAMLDGLLEGSVKQVTAESLAGDASGYTVLDARPEAEFEVGRLESARRVGFRDFSKKTVVDLPKDKPVLVYCSVGYRSEKIGEKLQKLGFTKVYNLRGGIFDWYNHGYPVFDEKGQTDRVHPYDKEWGKWLKREPKIDQSQ